MPTAPNVIELMVDQAFVPFVIETGSVSGTVDGQAQSFTAGVNGELEAADVLIDAGTSGVEVSDVVVEVRVTSNGAPIGITLTRGTIPAGTLVPTITPKHYESVEAFTRAFAHVTFDPHVPVVTGQVYALMFRASGRFGKIYGYGTPISPSPYAGGAAFGSNGSDWFRFDGLDWYFRTYVRPR